MTDVRAEQNHREDPDRDRGDVMAMTTIVVVFLMLSAWALISASQQWGARRDVQATAAAAARAAAQVGPDEIRAGVVGIDPIAAEARASVIFAASGHTGSVTVDGVTVTVTAVAPVTYAFPTPGFPASVTSRSSALASRGVRGDEGG